MKKILGSLALASTFVLTACGGGSSDSSGTLPSESAQKHMYETGFATFPNCETQASPDGRLIIHAGRNNTGVQLPTPTTCKITLPDLNQGWVFSLKCDAYVDRKSPAKYQLNARTDSTNSIRSVFDKGDKYILSCLKDRLEI